MSNIADIILNIHDQILNIFFEEEEIKEIKRNNKDSLKDSLKDLSYSLPIITAGITGIFLVYLLKNVFIRSSRTSGMLLDQIFNIFQLVKPLLIMSIGPLLTFTSLQLLDASGKYIENQKLKIENLHNKQKNNKFLIEDNSQKIKDNLLNFYKKENINYSNTNNNSNNRKHIINQYDDYNYYTDNFQDF